VALDKWQRNSIFRAIEASGLDVAQCELDVDGDTCTVFERRSGATLVVTHSEHHHLVKWDIPDGSNEQGGLRYTQWRDVLEAAGTWGRAVQYVVEVPDLWEELKELHEILAAAGTAAAGDAHFNYAEQAEIAKTLDEIKKFVREHYSLTPEQAAAIEEKIDALIEAATKVGRKDWLMILYGTIFTLMMTDLVATPIARHILEMAMRGLAHLFGIDI
jgi:hypothetical protein